MEVYQKVQAALRADPISEKIAEEPHQEHKRYNLKRLTYAKRKASLVARLDAINSVAGDPWKTARQKMGDLKSPLKQLRPLLADSETWDYCVVWKLCADGISSSVESCTNSPIREATQEMGFLSLCRDSFNPHPASDLSCLALARIPFSIMLQSDVYGEVVASGQPRWINLPDTLSLKSSHEAIGTRVLIPVLGGLVELFAAKQISESQDIMRFVAAQFDVYSEVEEERGLFTGDCTKTLIDYFQEPDLAPSNPSLPSCLNPGFPSQNSSLKTQNGTFSSLEDAKGNNDQNQAEQNLEVNSDCDTDTHVTRNDISIVSHEEKKKPQFKSKNLICERKRRAKIQSRLLHLRSMVPKITKMSVASTIDDAANHILEMNKKVQELQEELEELERDDACNNIPKSKPFGSKETAQVADKLCNSTHGPGSNSSILHQIEVDQLSKRGFLIRILCEAKLGGFTTLLTTLECLGLLVTEVNFTSCNGLSSASFMVQDSSGKIQAAELRETLFKLSCGASQKM